MVIKLTIVSTCLSAYINTCCNIISFIETQVHILLLLYFILSTSESFIISEFSRNGSDARILIALKILPLCNYHKNDQ